MKAHFRFYSMSALLLLALNGCGVMKIKQQTEILESACTITGTIKRNTNQEGPLMAMLFEFHGDLITLEGSLPTNEKGEFLANVTPGSYQIVAFVDSNSDGQYQTNEHAAFDRNNPIITVSSGETAQISPLTITSEVFTDENYDLTNAASKAMKNIGKLTKLDDPIFTRENYKTGMWRPMDFLQTIGGGLFMLQEYQADKTPVIFIHGINGGPEDWRTAIESLDHNKFQPWVFYYPSGLQLDFNSNYLVMAVSNLQERYHFDKVLLAAHSMGGLVARSFVKKFIENHPSKKQLIQLMVTVNSPMNGMRSAAKGVKLSPIIVQSWRDVAEGSDFITDLHNWPWPEHIPYHLIFSFQVGEGSDGVVPLDSQIPMNLQNESTRIYGFINNHVGTLNDKAFLELFNELLLENL